MNFKIRKAKSAGKHFLFLISQFRYFKYSFHLSKGKRNPKITNTKKICGIYENKEDLKKKNL